MLSSLRDRTAERVTRTLHPPLRWGLGHALPRSAIGASARRGDLHARLIVASGGEVPAHLFDEIRSEPLHRAKYAYVTARQAVVRELLSSPDVTAGVDLSAGGGPLGRLGTWAAQTTPPGPLRAPSLLATDPPDHTRLRKLVTRVFSARAVQRLRVRTEEIAEEMLDALEDADRQSRDLPGRQVDLVERYCSLLPVTVIAEVLGVPTQQRDLVLRLGNAVAPSLDLGLSWGRFREVERSLTEFDTWLSGHIEDKRRHPGDDLLSQLVAARDEDGVALSDREVRSTAGLVLAAGFETTVNLLGNGIKLLHDHPDQLEVLGREPERWGNAVDEVLRLDPPVLLTGRTIRRDTTIAGVRLRRGAVVTALLAGANRDPEVFADADRFDITRANATDHVAFSAGRHFCLGAALARMEGEVGLHHLVERFPGLHLQPGARRRRTRILRGWATLPAKLT